MKIMLSLFFLGLGVAGIAQDAKHGFLYMNKPLSSDAVSQAEVSTSGGSIQVTGVANSSEARIEVYVSGNNRNNYSNEELSKKVKSDYDVNISVASKKLTATAKGKRSNDGNNTLNISFRVYVPVNCGTELNTSGGSISLDNLNGYQHFSTSGGGLSVNKISGRINGHTSGGGIEITDSKDDIELETSGGGIDAKNCAGKIRLGTSGGSLSLKDLNGTIQANTSGGNVDGVNIEGELETHTSGGNIAMSNMRGSLKASTSGGNMHVQISQLGKYVKLSNSGGNINLEIPKDKGLSLDIHGGGIKTDGLNNFSGSVEKESINGTLNGGGIPVDVQGGSGNVTLAMR